MLDLLIRNGTVFDGSGRPGFVADVAIEGNRIVHIGRLESAVARQVIDATGKAVAPGFIDIHTHSELPLLVDGRAMSKVMQGVTLEVVGNCGTSPGPRTPVVEARLRALAPADDELQQWTWQTTGEFMDKLQQRGIALNVAFLVGHGSLRTAVMGTEQRPPTPVELRQMQERLRLELEQGALGLSTGLIYAPSMYAQTEELIALARVLREMGRIYASHIRGEGDTVAEAIDEAITIGRQTGVPVQISHLKATGRQNWGRAPALLRLLEQARGDGIDVMADQYPYVASSTTLTAVLPPWALSGGIPQLLRRLQDPTQRALIRQQITEDVDGWVPLLRGCTFADLIIASFAPDPSLEGQSLADIAAQRGLDPSELTLQLLEEAGGEVSIIRFAMSEEDVRTILQHPLVMVGSDGSALAADGPLSRGKPHPRAYGTFPRVLGHYVRDERVLSLPEAVRKMTALPAMRLGLKERGRLVAGYRADIVVFDPATVAERATWANPHQYPCGIEWVLVNGVPVVAHGQHTGARPGRVLRWGVAGCPE